MKRSEVTVESLKALGYVARKTFVNAWRFKSRTDELCNEKQAAKLFEVVANIARSGGAVEIRSNNFEYTVNVFVDCTRHQQGGAEMVYYLSRPMSEAERLEADLYTGRNKKVG